MVNEPGYVQNSSRLSFFIQILHSINIFKNEVFLNFFGILTWQQVSYHYVIDGHLMILQVYVMNAFGYFLKLKIKTSYLYFLK